MRSFAWEDPIMRMVFSPEPICSMGMSLPSKVFPVWSYSVKGQFLTRYVKSVDAFGVGICLLSMPSPLIVIVLQYMYGTM